MVADKYFDLRSRLGTALFSLGQVADLAGLEPSRVPVVKSLVEGLRDPFVFVVAGEVNAGKSTLLNALFGEEFCPSGVLPETRRIHYFRYDRTPHRTTVSEVLEEIGLPHAFLRDFHVVDTPGVNSIEAGHELITGDFIPRADAVLYCFPATNPWSEAGWHFLERIHGDWLKKVVLVLQQSDLRTPEEVAAISEHMRSIARQRLGEELPVFAVSARLALLARTSGVDKSRLLADSSLPGLEHHLTTMVSGAAAHMGRLVSACSTGQALLAEVQSRIEASAVALEKLTQVKRDSVAALAAMQANTAETIDRLVRHVREAWKTHTTTAFLNGLAGRLPFPALLWRRDPTADSMESRLLPPLMKAVHEAAETFHHTLNQHMSSLWSESGAAIHRSLEGRVRPEPEPGWPDRKVVFTALLENAVCDAVAQSGLGAFWVQRLQQRARMMRGLVLIGGLVLAVAGMAAAGGRISAQGVLTVAGLMAALTIAGVLALRRETRETAAGSQPLLEAAGDQLEVSVRGILTTHSQTRLADFDPVVAPLEAAIMEKQQLAAPLEAETAQLAVNLQTLSRALRSGLG